MVTQPASGAETAGEPLVLRETVDGVAVVTLNNPRRLNALSMAMLESLQQALDEVGADESVRAMVLRGAGRGFCAGHDLKEIDAHRRDADEGRGYFAELFDKCTKVMLTIARLPVVVIAEVHGIATAAGCQMVATCDMAVASSDARFGVNGVDAGLFCSTPMVALSRNIPRKVTMEMLVLGEIIDAGRAAAFGLVNHVFPAEELSGATLALAMRAAQKSRAVVALGKQAFYRQIELGIVDAYRHMSDVMVENLLMKDSEIGICAFIEKRIPEWEDR